MCGRAAVIRAGMGLARAVGARRIIHDAHSAPRRAAAGGGGGGFVRDGGGAAGHRAAVDDAAPAAAAADSSDSFPDVSKQKQQSHSSQPAEQSQKELITPTAASTDLQSYSNYNCGPTSSVPVWRLQTAEEQRELLQLEKKVDAAVNAVVKEELEELAADAIKAETTHTQIQAVPVLQYMHWGFPNPLANRKGGGGDGGFRSHVFNARSETIDEKRMFRELVHKKRCVVLVDGFYEWHTEYSSSTGEALKKQGYYFHMPLSGGQAPTITIKSEKKQSAQSQTPTESPFPIMHLAGLYDAAINDETGETTYSVVVLTCEPSKEMRAVHTRMPVILSPGDAARWVDVERFSWKEVKPLMKPYEGLGFYQVPPVVNNARNHGVECIEPLDAYTARMKGQGIAKFFSPVKSPKTQQQEKMGKHSPAPSSSASSKEPVPARTQSLTNSAVANSDDPFFNTHGAPGKSFSSRVNPADPGQMGGSKEPAVTAPSTVTSDAAIAAELFVQKVEQQHPHAEHKTKEEAGSKRKQPSSHPASSHAAAAAAPASLALPLPAGLEDDDDLFDMDDQTMPFESLSPEVVITVNIAAKKQRTEQ